MKLFNYTQYCIVLIIFYRYRETIQVKRKTPRENFTLSVSEQLGACYIYLECDTSQYCTVTSTISNSQQTIGDRLMV